MEKSEEDFILTALHTLLKHQDINEFDDVYEKIISKREKKNKIFLDVKSLEDDIKILKEELEISNIDDFISTCASKNKSNKIADTRIKAMLDKFKVIKSKNGFNSDDLEKAITETCERGVDNIEYLRKVAISYRDKRLKDEYLQKKEEMKKNIDKNNVVSMISRKLNGNV